MGSSARLLIALGFAAILCLLALLTWIAVRVDQGVRKLRPTPPPEPCDRLHVSEISVPTFRQQAPVEEPLAIEDLPAFQRDMRRIDNDEILGTPRSR